MNPLVLASGALCGFGAALAVSWLLPARPALADALARLDPSTAPEPRAEGDGEPGVQDRLGAWLERRVPAAGVGASSKDLDLLGVSRASFLGQRALYAVIGLLFPACFTLVMAMLGIGLPVTVPAVGGLLLSGALSFVPVVEVRRRAGAAREDFARAVASYMDLVALDKRAGAGTSAALVGAANVGDSWVFRRIRATILEAELGGTSPWDALTRLGQEVGVPALADLGDIMRLSGVEGVGVYGALRGRAAATRDQLLAADQARANAASEALAMPVAALGLAFLALLGTPALLQIALSL